MKTIFCPYCGYRARFSQTSSHLYQGRDFGPVYECPKDCNAYVGVHKETLEPLGRLANKALRQLKMQAHEVFDPLHRDLQSAYPDIVVFPKHMKRMARGRAYNWLADQMNIRVDDCHIAAFDDAQCRLAIEIIQRLKPTSATVREWFKARKQEFTAT